MIVKVINMDVLLEAKSKKKDAPPNKILQLEELFEDVTGFRLHILEDCDEVRIDIVQ